MHGLPDFSTFLVGGRFTKLTIPSVISAYGRQRRSNPCCPWQRIQSRRIVARRRLLSASRIFARERGCRPWIAAERCALHCAKKHPRRASVARLRAIDLCCPAIIKLGTDSLSTTGTRNGRSAKLISYPADSKTDSQGHDNSAVAGSD